MARKPVVAPPPSHLPPGGAGAFICPELREAAPYVQRDVLQGSYVSEPHQLNASYFR
jgi:hypothetical protein